MELTEIVIDKPYYAIRFEDIAEWWILGVRCGLCRHEAPVDRDRLKKRSGEQYLRFATKFCRCTQCGNMDHHRVYVAGKLPR
ncbi:hypothetical protein C8D77_101182 [Mesorhizobium loti]|uniref:Uncharacterized protein n=1 Tax=Rhizobium loti TaxID=381 RepID=A0A8E3B760_RHILI|nr:hypothetical protein [Mesorhizobium loti]PWJ93503.1 hypothetical protein C8D77_101182 [Mesorhizobium loti]